jgi:hypothetical protein
VAISDGYSRLAVGHAMGERATVELANAVADAVAPCGFTPPPAGEVSVQVNGHHVAPRTR